MFKIRFDGYLEDDLYETYEEAEEAALEMVSNFNTGNEILYDENPGDWEEENDGNTGDYEIVEVDRYGNEI